MNDESEIHGILWLASTGWGGETIVSGGRGTSLQGGGVCPRATVSSPILCPFHSHKTKSIHFQNGDTLWILRCFAGWESQLVYQLPREQSNFQGRGLCQWRNCHVPSPPNKEFLCSKKCIFSNMHCSVLAEDMHLNFLAWQRLLFLCHRTDPGELGIVQKKTCHFLQFLCRHRHTCFPNIFSIHTLQFSLKFFPLI